MGLLRWVFVVSVIANSYINAGNKQAKIATIIIFKTIHLCGGMLLVLLAVLYGYCGW